MPQVGCYAERCQRARGLARPRFATSLALVEPGEERYFLVDATPDLTRQVDLIPEEGFRRRAAERRPFDGIFLTHGHIGHYLGLALLGREGLGIAPTPTYCSDRFAAYLRDNGPWSLMVDEGRLDLRPVQPGRWYDLGGSLSAMALLVPHRQEFTDTVGWVFAGPSNSLLYLPDVDRWDRMARPIGEWVDEVDVAILDGSFYSADEVPGRPIEDIPHPLIPRTMDLLQASVDAGATVVFTHFNNTNPALWPDSPEAQEIHRRGFSTAFEGRRFDL